MKTNGFFAEMGEGGAPPLGTDIQENRYG
jgi:hypothetical protein